MPWQTDSEPLIDEQVAATKSDERVIAVLAGPGSGKTRTLCERARVLLERDAAGSVLLLTFMNKAAAEMKARALATTQAPSNRLLASTYHTLGLRILDAHRDLIGLDEIDVLDAPEAEKLLVDVAGDLAIDNPDRWPWRLSRLRLSDSPLSGTAARLEEAYAARKRDLGVVDFDDLIVLPADLLAAYPAIAESWSLRYPHLLIDEFQDTNASQFRVVRALASHAATVTVVADDDQAIMRFAGADATNIRTFVSELGAVAYPLVYNHRCRRRIVEAANRLISADPLASGRQMKWVHDGGEVSVVAFDNATDEALAVVRDTEDRLAAGAKPTDFAVLARTSRRSDMVVDAFQKAGLPVNDWRASPQPDEARQFVAVCLALLRARLSPRMRERATQVLGFDGDSQETRELLELNADLAAAQQLTALKQDVFTGLSPSVIVERIREIAADVRPSFVPQIEAFLCQTQAFEAHDADFSTEHLLDLMALGMPSHGAPTESAGIKVATLHRTKGLEWPHVWIVGLEEGTLPFYLADAPDEVRDERRLLFVGICRAEHHLTLSRVSRLSGWSKAPSSFVAELSV